ncbi:substrate-binding periplasmic protein [Kiloniella sp.]|uniref:substrate-binding periplasmic protein n=1 Tax=Kiloniella sp. TaxID=1938587 RepID=UPI003A8D4118
MGLINRLSILQTVVMTFFSSAVIAAEPVIITTHELPPYSYFDEENNFTGIATTVLECVLHKLEKPYKIQVVPWKRAQILVQNHEADGFYAASKNAFRDSYAVMTKAIAEQTWTWYLRKESLLDPQSNDFKKNANVSSFLGANMHKWLIANDYNVSNTPATDTKSLLRMLLSDRFEAVLANELVMDRLLHKTDQLEHVRKVDLKNKPLGVYFSNRFLLNNPGFIEQFNQQVTPCRKDSDNIAHYNHPLLLPPHTQLSLMLH